MKYEKYYWLFYIKSKKLQDQFIDYLCGDLYAYALDKKLAKKFMKERDMSKFVTKKVLASDHLVHELTAKFQGGILQPIELRTRVIDGTMGIVRIIGTSNESSVIFSTEAAYIYRPNSLFQIASGSYLKPSIVKERYRKALDVLSYGFIIAATQGDVLLLDDDDTITFDQLEILIKIFGKLFAG